MTWFMEFRIIAVTFAFFQRCQRSSTLAYAPSSPRLVAAFHEGTLPMDVVQALWGIYPIPAYFRQQRGEQLNAQRLRGAFIMDWSRSSG